MTHTPGKWVWDDEYSIYVGSIRVASVNTYLDDWEDNVALIARAPDLLAENEALRVDVAGLLGTLRTLSVALLPDNPSGKPTVISDTQRIQLRQIIKDGFARHKNAALSKTEDET